MNFADIVTDNLFLSPPVNPITCLHAQEARISAMAGSPKDRAEFFRDIHVNTKQFINSLEFLTTLIERARRTKYPGGLWLIGDGGTGKSFLFKKLYEKYPPIENTLSRHVPVLVISLDEKTSESSILIYMLLQLGQDPELLHFKDNDDLREQVIDALHACGTLAILFDESHHIWLKPNGNVRSADRSGGTIGGFLKLLYDRTGVAMIFAGTLGLEKVLELNDKQSNTRWPAEIRLCEFQFDEQFIGLMNVLDEAVPLPKKSDLGEMEVAKKIHQATNGNFRSLKNFLAEAVFIASESNSQKIESPHLRLAFFNLFGLRVNPFA